MTTVKVWFARGGLISRCGPFTDDVAAAKAMDMVGGGKPENFAIWPELVEVRNAQRPQVGGEYYAAQGPYIGCLVKVTQTSDNSVYAVGAEHAVYLPVGDFCREYWRA